jgi:host factor-I protein
MSKIQMNLQDSFLNATRRQNIPVTVQFTDGTKIKGKVNGFDNFTVILEINRIDNMIYKHAIACIFPERALDKHSTPRGVAEAGVEKTTAVSPVDLGKFKTNMEAK